MANAAAVIQTRDILVYEEEWATGNALPADTVLWGVTWGGSWVDLGYTDGGVEFRAGVDFADVNVDQSLDPVYQVPTGRDLGARFNMAEINAVNFKLASGMGAITTVAAGAARGHDDLTISGTIAQVFQTLGIDVKNPGDGEAIRIFLKKVFPTGSQSLPFRPNDKAVISYDARAYPDTTASNLVAIIRDIIPIV